MLKKYADHPRTKCPRCKSPSPHLHPAVQFEGEVHTCPDAYHHIETNQNRPKWIAASKARAAELSREG